MHAALCEFAFQRDAPRYFSDDLRRFAIRVLAYVGKFFYYLKLVVCEDTRHDFCDVAVCVNHVSCIVKHVMLEMISLWW
jgi:hypothetical protein